MVLGDGLFKGGWVFILQKVLKREERERLRSTSNASSENFFDWRFPKCPLPLGTSNVFLFLISRKLSGETKWGSKGNSMRDCLRSVKQSSHRRVSITHTHTLSHSMGMGRSTDSLEILSPVSTSTLPLCCGSLLGPDYSPPSLCMFSLLGNHFTAMCFRFLSYKIEILVSPYKFIIHVREECMQNSNTESGKGWVAIFIFLAYIYLTGKDVSSRMGVC